MMFFHFYLIKIRELKISRNISEHPLPHISLPYQEFSVVTTHYIKLSWDSLGDKEPSGINIHWEGGLAPARCRPTLSSQCWLSLVDTDMLYVSHSTLQRYGCFSFLDKKKNLETFQKIPDLISPWIIKSY